MMWRGARPTQRNRRSRLTGAMKRFACVRVRLTAIEVASVSLSPPQPTTDDTGADEIVEPPAN